MEKIIRDYLSIVLSALTLALLFFGWASDALDHRINTAVNKAVDEAMAPFVAQLKANTQALQKHDDRFKSLETQVAAVEEVEF